MEVTPVPEGQAKDEVYMRTMTERDYEALVALRDLAVVLDDQIEAIGGMVRALVCVDDDEVNELIRNGGSVDDFLKSAGVRVARNGDASKPKP